MIRQLLTKIQFERITVMMETLGVVSLSFFNDASCSARTNKLRQTSLTNTLDRAHSVGVRTVSPVSVILMATKTLASASGMRKSSYSCHN